MEDRIAKAETTLQELEEAIRQYNAWRDAMFAKIEADIASLPPLKPPHEGDFGFSLCVGASIGLGLAGICWLISLI